MKDCPWTQRTSALVYLCLCQRQIYWVAKGLPLKWAPAMLMCLGICATCASDTSGVTFFSIFILTAQFGTVIVQSFVWTHGLSTKRLAETMGWRRHSSQMTRLESQSMTRDACQSFLQNLLTSEWQSQVCLRTKNELFHSNDD